MDEHVVLVGVDSGGRKLADQINKTLGEVSGEEINLSHHFA